MLAGRAPLVLIAALVLGWLGVMERNTRLEANGVGHLRAGQVVRAEADYRRARLLNPDTTPDTTRALLYVGHRQFERGMALLDKVLRREPDNIVAWGELLVVSRGRDPAATRRAAAEIRRLDPLDAPRR
jgi:hypothetical protein